MRAFFVVVFFFLNFFQVQSQITFQANWGEEKLILGKYYPFNEHDSLRIDELKMYVSNFHFYGNTHSLQLNEPHLIDFTDSATTTLFQGKEVSGFQKLDFLVGLDSLVNSTDNFSGELDPVNGMYWAWNSGYIAFKITGNSNVITENKSQFEFHLGGFRYPNNASQEVHLANSPVITIDLKDFLTNNLDLKTENHVLLPSKKAVLLMQKIASGIH